VRILVVGCLVVVLSVSGSRAGATPSVRVDPPSVPLGGLVVVRADAPVASARFDGRPLVFFPQGDASVALIGVDLDRRPGRYPIEVEGRTGWKAEATLEVVDRQFPEERLTLPKAYVEPDRKTLARIAREAKLLAALWGNSDREPHWTGAFVHPTDGAAGSPFGLRRFFNGEPRSPHAGIDFRSPEGTPVAAANAGQVVLARELFFTGNTVVLDHGCGLFTMYVHLFKVAVRPGERVDKGRTIGQVGMTGRATGPHLHFAARVGDARIDPAMLLDRDPGGPMRTHRMGEVER
jgi:murein DD-endopeptidase MepM/ murein hydrolase activator NlpD